jgi:hypothetical protein
MYGKMGSMSFAILNFYYFKDSNNKWGILLTSLKL